MSFAPNRIKSRGARLLGQGSANFDKVQLSSSIAQFQSIAFCPRFSSRESPEIHHSSVKMPIRVHGRGGKLLHDDGQESP